MRRWVVFVFSIACAAAQFVTPVPSVMPDWMVPYPGVSAQNRQVRNRVESSYTVAAAARDVLSHFRNLFASAGLPFEPDAMGGGFVIRAHAAECDLDISIRRGDPDTAVKVTCSPRLEANERMANLRAEQRAEHAQSDPMKKFDTPVYPQPKPPQRALAWPSWLVRVDGAALPVERSNVRLKSTFTSQPTRDAIQAYYAELFRSHDYHVAQSVAAAPDQFGCWVQASARPDPELGRNVVIWVHIRPAGQNFAVEITVQ